MVICSVILDVDHDITPGETGLQNCFTHQRFKALITKTFPKTVKNVSKILHVF